MEVDDDLTVIQIFMLHLLEYVKEIFMKENNLGFKLAITTWVSVSILMTLGFIINIVFAIK